MNVIWEYHIQHKKKALENLKSQISKPLFPMSLWETVLIDQYINLNKLYAIQSGQAKDEETIHKSGQFKFIFNQIQSKVTIYDQGAWGRAFDIYADALTFTYPHQEGELQAYCRYIQKLFEQVGSYKHCNVIKFDQKFWKELAADSCLTYDDAKVSQALLYGSLDANNGSGRNPSRRGAGGSSEICQ